MAIVHFKYCVFSVVRERAPPKTDQNKRISENSNTTDASVSSSFSRQKALMGLNLARCGCYLEAI